jgi:hypothetical protein
MGYVESMPSQGWTKAIPNLLAVTSTGVSPSVIPKAAGRTAVAKPRIMLQSHSEEVSPVVFVERYFSSSRSPRLEGANPDSVAGV